MTPLVPTARRAPSRRLPAATAAALASSAALILLAAAPAHAATSLSTFEAQDVAEAAGSLIGEHVTLASASLAAGRGVQAGSFADLDLGLPAGPVSGVALSTGSLRAADPSSAADVDFTVSALTGPNAKLTTTGDLGGGGSAVLESSFGRTTYDAAELHLELVPAGETLTIVYQIGSEEYAGWAGRDYTDAFGVYVDGRLCSTVGDLPVAVHQARRRVRGVQIDLVRADVEDRDPHRGQRRPERLSQRVTTAEVSPDLHVVDEQANQRVEVPGVDRHRVAARQQSDLVVGDESFDRGHGQSGRSGAHGTPLTKRCRKRPAVIEPAGRPPMFFMSAIGLSICFS